MEQLVMNCGRDFESLDLLRKLLYICGLESKYIWSHVSHKK